MNEQLRDTAAPRPVLGRVEAFHGRVFDIVTEEVDLGVEVVSRDVMVHPGAVAIIAYREPGEVLVLRQYRHPVGAELWEPPAGLLDVAGEDPWVAAKRELHEEADLEAATWHVLADVYSSPGGSSEAIRMYLARDLTPVPEDGRHAREGEERDMEVRWIPLDEAIAAVLDGRFGSPTSVIGFLGVEAARARGWATLRPADAPWAARLPKPGVGEQAGASEPGGEHPHGTYRATQDRDRAELTIALASKDPSVVCNAIIDASFYREARWLVPVLLERAEDTHPSIRGAALLGLMHLARRGELRPNARIWGLVVRAADGDPDERVRGEARQIMDDFDHWCGLGWAGSPRP